MPENVIKGYGTAKETDNEVPLVFGYAEEQYPPKKGQDCNSLGKVNRNPAH